MPTIAILPIFLTPLQFGQQQFTKLFLIKFRQINRVSGAVEKRMLSNHRFSSAFLLPHSSYIINKNQRNTKKKFELIPSKELWRNLLKE